MSRRETTDQISAIQLLVQRDKIRALPSCSGEVGYFTTPKGAEGLAKIGIKTLTARHPVDDEGHHFGHHTRRIKRDGRGGYLKVLGEGNVAPAFAGARVVPLQEQEVSSYVETLLTHVESQRVRGHSVGVTRSR